MKRKESCKNTDYTGGFRIFHEKDGSFVAIKGQYKLKAKTAKEIDELIKNFPASKEVEVAKKKLDEQNTHDACVRTIAEDLKKDNWLVKANTEDWEKPSRIGGITPDVMAHKGCLKRICQIVSEKDFEGDKTSYRDFKNYCKEYDFQLYVIGKNGKLRPADVQTLTEK